MYSKFSGFENLSHKGQKTLVKQELQIIIPQKYNKGVYKRNFHKEHKKEENRCNPICFCRDLIFSISL